MRSTACSTASYSSGESCIAGSRLFVERSIYDEFVTRLVARDQARSRRAPVRKRTQMGPLITATHREAVERYVELGRAEGGEILHRRRAAARRWLSTRASIYQPTILDGLSNRRASARKKSSARCWSSMPFDDEEDADRAGQRQRLRPRLRHLDPRLQARLARRARGHTGTVWINTYKQFSISTPFGGAKTAASAAKRARTACAPT